MRHLELTDAQRLELLRLRDTASKPYLREKAAALLKVAAGIPAARVARSGLLRPRKPHTLYRWLNRYQQDGVQGLLLCKGRGRKPAFSPCASASGERQSCALARDPS